MEIYARLGRRFHVKGPGVVEIRTVTIVKLWGEVNENYCGFSTEADRNRVL